MIGPIIVAVAAVVLVAGLILVFWDWVIRSEPDAPHGGPVVAIAIVGLLCGGVISCSEAVKDVHEMKAARMVKP